MKFISVILIEIDNLYAYLPQMIQSQYTALIPKAKAKDVLQTGRSLGYIILIDAEVKCQGQVR